MRTNTRKLRMALVVGLTVFAGLTAVALAGTFTPITVADQTPTAPLANPVPSSYQPRYVSGFGSDNSFTVFFEDRDAEYAISYASTTNGPTGLPAGATATNIVDTHFCIKDWPITIGGTTYAYRAWGSVGNNTQHHFYVSNDLTNWTLVSPFTIPNVFAGARGWVYYGFHDVIELNGTYYAFAESNQSQTMIVRSANGDDLWEAFASVGGSVAGDGPLGLPAGVAYGWTPSGNFLDLGHDRGYGKIYVHPFDTDFYLVVNTAAKASLPPADLEAAFINPANWTWHDGITGPAANPILSETSEHDLRECWVVPNSDPDADWAIIYDADFGSADGGKALGYATLAPPMPPPATVYVDDDYDATSCSTDGHTWQVDCFDVIQDGVDAVVSGGTVNLANGTYNATSSPFVRITKSLTLVGESRDSVILDGAGTSTIAWAKGIHVTANDVTIKNLTVQNFGAPGYWGYGVLFRDYAHDTPGEGYIYYHHGVVENVRSQNNCYPMYALVNRDLTIRNCLIQNNLGDGMFIARESDNATITGNTVINSGDHGIWVGKCWMGLGPSDNATITNNTVDGAREGGISFVASDGATISGNTILHVAGEGWSKGALSLKDGPSNVEAYNNTIYNNDGSWGGYSGTGHGVGIDGTPSNINLRYNNIYGNTGYGVYNYSTVVVMAEYNWWGDISGPYDPSNDTGTGGLFYPTGTGDEVSDYVDYDPWIGKTLEPGTATGGGWFIPEWDKAEGLVTPGGKATFGFVAKHKKGTSSGQLEFQYHADGLNLKSTSYYWVTVASPQVMFKGEGTLNGEPGYKFQVHAFDGDQAGGQPDRFTIRIWTTGGDSFDSPTYRAEGDLGGGQIVVHKK